MLKNFFNPRSIAVIGASAEKKKLGYTILRNIINYGFSGKVYPINLKTKKIQGLKAYPSVKAVPKKIDLAIIVIPAKFVNQVLKECGEKKVENVIVISAGFKEVGGQGKELEKELQKIARKYQINLLGPNCLGLLDSTIKLNASFAEGMIKSGEVAFMSQSGAICSAMLDWAQEKRFGFSRFISLGNKAGVNENDLIEFFINDKKTKVVLAYLEGFFDGQKFLNLARKLSAKKPLIILKSGKTQVAKKAISSHTGSLAGSYSAVKAAFEQTNTVVAENLTDLFNLIKLFSRDYKIKNNQVAVVANAGGPAVLTTDSIAESDLRLADLTKETKDKLTKDLPFSAGINNPVDVIGDADADRYELALKTVLNDKNVGSAITILTPQTVTEVEKTAKVIIQQSKQTQKPILTSFIGGSKVRKGIELLSKNKIPHYLYPETAVHGLQKYYSYQKCKGKKQPPAKINIAEKNKIKVKKILAKADKTVDFLSAEKILKSYDIPVINSGLAQSGKQAGEIAQKLKFPVAMKVISRDILHKSDVGGVKIGLKTKAEVEEVYAEIIKNCQKNKPKAEITGVLIQPLFKGRELIFGLKRDPQFGPLLMFGLGGVYVEVLKDVSFGLAPLSRQQAENMIKKIKTYKLLTGVRGEKAVNLKSIVSTILKLSQLAMDFSEIKELDINPALVNEQGLKAVDMRILID
ncbi:MAG TPA: acetate--CoA ligase family protein [Patescibacteria group bacterium]|nr:acetate--CoA ligase family protein [Patescibacteria group bacterium]